jgi:hypothetical protein
MNNDLSQSGTTAKRVSSKGLCRDRGVRSASTRVGDFHPTAQAP